MNLTKEQEDLIFFLRDQVFEYVDIEYISFKPETALLAQSAQTPQDLMKYLLHCFVSLNTAGIHADRRWKDTGLTELYLCLQAASRGDITTVDSGYYHRFNQLAEQLVFVVGQRSEHPLLPLLLSGLSFQEAQTLMQVVSN